MLFGFVLITFLLSSTSKAAVPISVSTRQQVDTCSLASFDRCGPANQIPGTKSTCNATITSAQTPQVYGYQCSQNFDIKSTLNYPNCVTAITDICNKLTDPHVLRDRWIWTNPAYINCALGFWLPSGNGSDAAFAPDYNRCVNGIYGPLATACTNPSWNNVGGVNLAEMPNTNGTGTAVDPYYPSYVIAAAQLTEYAY